MLKEEITKVETEKTDEMTTFTVPANLFPVEHRFLDLDGMRMHLAGTARGEEFESAAFPT